MEDKRPDVLNYALKSIKLLRDGGIGRRRDEVNVKLLLKEFARESTVRHVGVPVFVPGLRAVAGYIVPGMVHKDRIHRPPLCELAERVWHVWKMPSVDQSI